MIENKELSIYVHIPFCIKKCRYCDFPSGVATVETRELYVQKLIDEISNLSIPYKKYNIKTVFFGGGTPSILSCSQFERIVIALQNAFPTMEINQELEFTIEINPGSVNREKLECYLSRGVNRLSIGLQSTVEEELKTLGRIHTYQEFLDTYLMAREVGFQNINIDLMSALPGQTIETYQKTLEQICALEPEHISAYSLIIEEGTPFYELYGDGKPLESMLPSEEADREMYALTKSILGKNGYHRYEISNYAKQGHECKHNLVYWKRGNYLGIGKNAASMVDNIRWSNGTVEKEELSQKEQMEEFLFLGLRCIEGIRKQDFFDEFQVKIEDIYGDIITKLIKTGLLETKGDFLQLTERGIDISNSVFVEFLLD